MKRKKILSIILTVAISVALSSIVINYSVSAKSHQNIKVMEYTPPTIVTKSAYQIQKFKNIENVQWLENNEVLSLTKKEEFQNPNSSMNIRYCSIYNLETKQSKDFKDANIERFFGVSPDKKYVLYSETTPIPEVGSEEWQIACDSGALSQKNLKILNLETGEIRDLVEEKIKGDAEFKWVGNDKIIVNYYTRWDIIDTTGKVCEGGSFDDGLSELVGIDGIKDLGDSVEGKFSVSQIDGVAEKKINTIDIKTKEIKTVYSIETPSYAKGKIIIMDNAKNNRIPLPDGMFFNITSEYRIIDEEGNIVRDFQVPEGKIADNYVLSPDGSKAIYLEMNNSENPSDSATIKAIDNKTGKIDEVIKASSLQEGNDEDIFTRFELANGETAGILRISNICWNSTNTSVSFTCGTSATIYCDQKNINTYVVSFDN